MYVDFANQAFSFYPTEDQCTGETHVCVLSEEVAAALGFTQYIVGLDEATCTNAEMFGGTWIEGVPTYGTATKDIFWRIIRINEDGSIRLIYQGNSADAIGDETTIGYSAYNNDAGKNPDNAYLGYMYGTPGSDNYEDTHANENDSTIKDFLDDWYVENLSSYASYLADPGFCNDRSVASEAKLWESYDTALGYGTNKTYYGAYNRLENEYKPQFKCPNASQDLFTLSTSTKRNKELTNPIGLITADEVAYAGGKAYTENATFYLNNGLYYWTMSPHLFDGAHASAWIVGVDGDLSNHVVVNDDDGVRPVINLKSDVEIVSGDGRIGSEYVIK